MERNQKEQMKSDAERAGTTAVAVQRRVRPALRLRVTHFREEIYPPLESQAYGWRTQFIRTSFIVDDPYGEPRAFLKTKCLSIPPGEPDILRREQCPKVFEQMIEGLLEDVIATYRPNDPKLSHGHEPDSRKDGGVQ